MDWGTAPRAGGFPEAACEGALFRKDVQMRKDYMPSNDLQYTSWIAQFSAALEAHAAALGVDPGELAPLQESRSEYASAYGELVEAKRAFNAATSLKVTKRVRSEKIIRPLVRRVQNHPGMTDEIRSELGLRPKHIVESRVPITELVPSLALEAGTGQVTVHWGPNPGNERKNGKPAGVKSANIYRRKAGEERYQLVANATASPYYDAITGPAADYTYIVRYRGTRQNDLSAPSPEYTIAVRGDLAA